jgi:hypothetical protein
MSNLTYNNLWKSTQNELERLATHDFEYQSADPQFDKHQIQTKIFGKLCSRLKSNLTLIDTINFTCRALLEVHHNCE